MRVLLVDNSKPHAAFFTPILHKTLLHHATVVVCRTREETAKALDGGPYDAVILSGSSLNMSETLQASAISKDLMVLLRYPTTPKLGICFGMQLMAVAYGGDVARLETSREGEKAIVCASASPLFPRGAHRAYFSHQDVVSVVPPGFVVDAWSDGVVGAFHSKTHSCYGVQFHPECSVLAAADVIPRFLQLARASLPRNTSRTEAPRRPTRDD